MRHILVDHARAQLRGKRFGVLAGLSTTFVLHLHVLFPITTELSAWCAHGFVLDLILIVALAVWVRASCRRAPPCCARA